MAAAVAPQAYCRLPVFNCRIVPSTPRCCIARYQSTPTSTRTMIYCYDILYSNLVLRCYGVAKNKFTLPSQFQYSWHQAYPSTRCARRAAAPSEAKNSKRPSEQWHRFIRPAASYQVCTSTSTAAAAVAPGSWETLQVVLLHLMHLTSCLLRGGGTHFS